MVKPNCRRCQKSGSVTVTPASDSPGSPHHRHGELPVPRPVELAEIDRLPGAERELPSLHRDRLREPHHDGLGVRVRVALLVLVVFLVARHGPLERVEDVGLHVGVGVLVEGDGPGRVPAEDRAEPALRVARRHDGAHALGDVDHLLLLAGGQLDGLRVEHQSAPVRLRCWSICHSPARSCTSLRNRGTVKSGTPASVRERRSTSRRSRSASVDCSIKAVQSRSESGGVPPSLICARCRASRNAATLSGPPWRRGSRCTRLTTTAAVAMRSSARARWKKSASWMVKGVGLVPRTKEDCGGQSKFFTRDARSLKPSNMPSNATMNPARSRRKSEPVKRASVRKTSPEGAANSLNPNFPALSMGPSTMRMALLSSTSRIRSAAWRKSSALVVGGVSSTTTSKRPDVLTW